MRQSLIASLLDSHQPDGALGQLDYEHSLDGGLRVKVSAEFLDGLIKE
jgi:hypothetical protein